MLPELRDASTCEVCGYVVRKILANAVRLTGRDVCDV